jgi:hypothetical protein
LWFGSFLFFPLLYLINLQHLIPVEHDIVEVPAEVEFFVLEEILSHVHDDPIMFYSESLVFIGIGAALEDLLIDFYAVVLHVDEVALGGVQIKGIVADCRNNIDEFMDGGLFLGEVRVNNIVLKFCEFLYNVVSCLLAGGIDFGWSTVNDFLQDLVGGILI